MTNMGVCQQTVQSGQRLPLLARSGCGDKEKVATATLLPQTERSSSFQNHHPVRSKEEAARCFLDVASTPPV